MFPWHPKGLPTNRSSGRTGRWKMNGCKTEKFIPAGSHETNRCRANFPFSRWVWQSASWKWRLVQTSGLRPCHLHCKGVGTSREGRIPVAVHLLRLLPPPLLLPHCGFVQYSWQQSPPPLCPVKQYGLQSHSWSSWDLTVQMTVRNRGFAGGADKLPIKTGWPDFFINRIIHLLEPGHDGFLKRDLLLHKSPIYHHPKVPLAMNHHSRVVAEISHGRTALQNIFASWKYLRNLSNAALNLSTNTSWNQAQTSQYTNTLTWTFPYLEKPSHTLRNLPISPEIQRFQDL